MPCLCLAQRIKKHGSRRCEVQGEGGRAGGRGPGMSMESKAQNRESEQSHWKVATAASDAQFLQNDAFLN